MGIKISYTDVTGQSVAASIERLSDNYFWNNTLKQFVGSSILFSDKKITMTEGSDENIGTYTGTNNGSLGTGDLLVRMHDLNDANISIASGQVYVLSGEEASRPVVIDNITAALIEALDSIELKVTKGNSSSAQRIQRQRARKQQRRVGRPNS